MRWFYVISFLLLIVWTGAGMAGVHMYMRKCRQARAEPGNCTRLLILGMAGPVLWAALGFLLITGAVVKRMTAPADKDSL